VEAVLAVWIDDVPAGGLKDDVLSGLADAMVAWLNNGGNLYLHCRQGVSRASYIDIAIHCRALGISAADALARIKARRPIADPNQGFMAQLQRLWPRSPVTDAWT
jgi:protein-tyrosine phosphatase